MPRFQATVAAAQTDTSLVAAIAGRRIRVTGLQVTPGSATTVTLNTKPAGSGVAISPALSAGTALPANSEGWFETNTGEGLSVTTSAGASSYVLGTYEIRY